MKFSTAKISLLALALSATTTAEDDFTCSVCGDGKEVGDPDGVFEFPGQPAINCGILEAAGESGLIPEAECLLIPPFIQDVCDCLDIEGSPIAAPSDPTREPTPSPIEDDPTREPTPSPIDDSPVEAPVEIPDPCEDVPQFEQKCDDTPSQIVLRYTGGDCDDSVNQQEGLFFCFDYEEGPTEEACMVVRDIRGGGTIYFEGEVNARSEEPIILEAAEGDDELEPNMNVTIYRDCDSQEPEDILETLIFHTSCSENLFLRDMFGAIEIIGFENDEQGSIDCENTEPPVPAPTRSPVFVFDTDSPTDEDIDPCEDIPQFETRCDDTPTQLTIRYTGGDCDDSVNQQDEEDLFYCQDLEGGPTTTACMVVKDIRGGSTVYYDDEVDSTSNEPILLTAEDGEFLEPNVNVTIYRDCDSKEFDDTLQTLVFHTSCNEVLFLGDRYGSVEIIGFENDEQGVVDCESTPPPTPAPVPGPTRRPTPSPIIDDDDDDDDDGKGVGGKKGSSTSSSKKSSFSHSIKSKKGSDHGSGKKGGKGGKYDDDDDDDSGDHGYGKGGKKGGHSSKKGSSSDDHGYGKGGKKGHISYGDDDDDDDIGKGVGGKKGSYGSSKSKKGGKSKTGGGKGGYSKKDNYEDDEEHDEWYHSY